jgi:type I restriction enzyme S subunit
VAEKAASLHRYALEEGDVLFSRMATVGRAAVVGSREAGSLINYHLMRLRLNQSVLDPNYLALLCRGSRAVQQHLTSSNHGVTRAGINTKQLMGLPLALPPRTEQTAIVEQVKAVDDLCSRFVRQVMQARQRAGTLRASILVTAFAGKLASQDASDEPASALLEQIAAQEASSSKQKVARAPKPRRERATA